MFSMPKQLNFAATIFVERISPKLTIRSSVRTESSRKQKNAFADIFQFIKTVFDKIENSVR